VAELDLLAELEVLDRRYPPTDALPATEQEGQQCAVRVQIAGISYMSAKSSLLVASGRLPVAGCRPRPTAAHAAPADPYRCAMRSLVVKATAGADAPERCSQAFTVAAVGVAAGANVSLWLTGESSWFALPGRAEQFELRRPPRWRTAQRGPGGAK
jgi:hypothetical protein